MRTSFLLFTLGIVLILSSCENDQLYHRLTVINGHGSGDFEAGSSVTITANNPPVGEAFLRWVGDTFCLPSAKAPTSQFNMPLQDIQLEAQFVDLPKFNLVINHGTGSGEYLEGTEVLIQGIAPEENMQFVKWEGDIEFVHRSDTFSTTVVMPAQAVTLDALFEEIEILISFKDQVYPIIKKRCGDSGCHDANSRDYPLSTHDEIRDIKNEIKSSLLDGRMPTGAPLSQEELDLIIKWIDQGAYNN